MAFKLLVKRPTKYVKNLAKQQDNKTTYSYAPSKPLVCQIPYVNEVTLRGQKPPLKCC